MKEIHIIERLSRKDITAQVIATNGLQVKNGECRVIIAGEDITPFIIFAIGTPDEF